MWIGWWRRWWERWRRRRRKTRFPFPLAGEGGGPEDRRMRGLSNGRHRDQPFHLTRRRRSSTPHPALRATFSRKGRRTMKVHRLPTPVRPQRRGRALKPCWRACSGVWPSQGRRVAPPRRGRQRQSLTRPDARAPIMQGFKAWPHPGRMRAVAKQAFREFEKGGEQNMRGSFTRRRSRLAAGVSLDLHADAQHPLTRSQFPEGLGYGQASPSYLPKYLGQGLRKSASRQGGRLAVLSAPICGRSSFGNGHAL